MDRDVDDQHGGTRLQVDGGDARTAPHASVSIAAEQHSTPGGCLVILTMTGDLDLAGAAALDQCVRSLHGRLSIAGADERASAGWRGTAAWSRSTQAGGDGDLYRRKQRDVASRVGSPSPAAASLAPPGTRWVLDLGSVGFVDAAGIGAVVRLHHHLAETSSQLVVCCAQQQPRWLLQLTAVTQVVCLRDTLAHALS